MAFFGLFGKEKKETLDKGLEKTKESVLSKISRAIAGKNTIDDDVLDNLEEALITSDVGVETTLRIIERKRSLFMIVCASTVDYCVFPASGSHFSKKKSIYVKCSFFVLFC